MIFPELQERRFGYVNIDLEARQWLKGKSALPNTNPLLRPEICGAMIFDIYQKYHLDFSYGGWMEDRRFKWRGSYLDEKKTFIHLGVDMNVPADTKIAADFNGMVVRIDDDYPEEGGWGPRIFLKDIANPLVMIYAHLDREICCKVGEIIWEGSVFARVGAPPLNGNWFPHLHIQTLSESHFSELQKNDAWNELDGYGAAEDISENSIRFPDPMQYVSLV